MKELLLVRHAKSSWKNRSLNDIDRPLSSRGKFEAPIMAKKINELWGKPEIILVSPAVRTLETSSFFLSEFGLDTSHINNAPQLYECSCSEIVSTLKSLPTNVSRVALIGHNPSIELFIRRFGFVFEKIPTLSSIVLRWDICCWKKIEDAPAKMLFAVWPKILK